MSNQEIKNVEAAAAKSLMVADYRKELYIIMATPGCIPSKVKEYVYQLDEDVVISLLTMMKNS
tara:strand:+ start:1071 stop:1259 length:189 start_codon:yes stop_codon:yes gene_type:complete